MKNIMIHIDIFEKYIYFNIILEKKRILKYNFLYIKMTNILNRIYIFYYKCHHVHVRCR